MDLLVASPATVSRCGMIYLEPHQLGWRPFMQSWLNTLPEPLKREEHLDALREMFGWLVDPCIRFVRYSCVEFVPTQVCILILDFSLARRFICLSFLSSIVVH